MLWHEQSWPQIQKLSKQMPVVIPLGSCEQHGTHLPVFVDTMQVSAIASRVQEKLRDDILLLPALWLGSSHHHRDFPGTVSVLPSLYAQMIQAIARSIIGAGFRRIFFLNGHGGNEVPAADALTELVAQDDAADDCYLTFASWWSIAKLELKADRIGMATDAITHACEYETSFMLFLRPDLVNVQNAQQSHPMVNKPWNDSQVAGRVKVYRRFHRLTAPGSMGEPAAATAQKGERIVQAVVEQVVTFLNEFQSWPDLPVVGPRPGGGN
jgi:creatinine amidohydrolase